MSEETPAAKTIDLLLEYVELEDELDAAQTIPLYEVENLDVVEEIELLAEEDIENAISDTRHVPRLEAEMVLLQEDPFQKSIPLVVSVEDSLDPALSILSETIEPE